MIVTPSAEAVCTVNEPILACCAFGAFVEAAKPVVLETVRLDEDTVRVCPLEDGVFVSCDD